MIDKEMEAQSLRSEMEKKVDVTNSEAMEAKLTRVKKMEVSQGCIEWKFHPSILGFNQFKEA